MSRAATFFGLWNREDPIGFRLGWLLGAALWLFVLAAMLTYSRFDPPGYAVAPLNSPVQNWCGPVGAWLSHQLFLMLGVGAWVVLGTAGLWLGLSAAGRPVGQLGVRSLGVLLFAIVVAGFHALLAPGWSSAPEGAGGIVAIWGVTELTARFGGLGAGLWLIFLGLIGATVAYDVWVVLAPKWALGRLGFGANAAYARMRERLDEHAARRAARVRENDVDDDQPAERARTSKVVAAKSKSRKPAKRVVEEIDDEEDEAPIDEVEEIDEVEDDEEEVPGAPQVFDPDELRAKMAKLPVRLAAESRRAATIEDLADLRAADTEMKDYQFPGLDLLEEPEANYSEKLESYVRDQATCLEEALRVYKIDGEVVGIDSGPVITMYEVKLAPGTKVSQLTAISQDLARAMKVVSIRIVANIEGRDTVGIEAPNIEKEKVRLKELMSVSEKTKNMRLPLFLGKDASGTPLIYDLASMPHMLIAGTTGSGKSVAINAIIMGFLYTKKPSELKMVLVDPKMVEMSQFKDIPHLMCPVVTEMGKAAAILEWAVNKMDERYELLAEAGCRDIDSYNELEWEELKDRLQPANELEEAKIPRKLPRIVYMIDELADLMMTHKEVETSIVRIAQKARAVGIHLLLATQRPQANVVTGLIKSNMPSRICFKVASGMDSRIVMDQKGGELLLGQGDMLFLSPRSSKVVRAQGTLVEDREIRRVVRFMKDVASPSFERTLMQLRSPGEAAPVNGVDLNAAATPDGMGRDWNKVAQEDPLFEKAVEIVIESGRGSVSLLQRRLAIGYTRASRLIELMGIAGVIGEHKGSVAREVLISPEEWNAMKDQAARDAAEAGGTLFAPKNPEDRPTPHYYDDEVDEPATSANSAAPALDEEEEEDFDAEDSADVDEEEEDEEASDEFEETEEEDEDADAEDEYEDGEEEEEEDSEAEDEYEEGEEEEEEDAEAEDEYDDEESEEEDEDADAEDEYEEGDEEEEEEDGEAEDEYEEGEEEEEEDEEAIAEDEYEEEEEESEDDEPELEVETPPFRPRKPTR